MTPVGTMTAPTADDIAIAILAWHFGDIIIERETMTTEFSDKSAVGALTNPDPEVRDAAATHLEGSINGGDLHALRPIALDLLALAERLAFKLANPADTEGEPDDAPHFIHTSCAVCAADIEGSSDSDDWRDRGNNSTCSTYEDWRLGHSGEFVTPPDGTKHRPYVPAEVAQAAQDAYRK